MIRGRHINLALLIWKRHLASLYSKLGQASPPSRDRVPPFCRILRAPAAPFMHPLFLLLAACRRCGRVRDASKAGAGHVSLERIAIPRPRRRPPPRVSPPANSAPGRGRSLMHEAVGHKENVVHGVCFITRTFAPKCLVISR